MDIVHRTVQGVELCTSLVTFLLKTTQDMVERPLLPGTSPRLASVRLLHQQPAAVPSSLFSNPSLPMLARFITYVFIVRDSHPW